MNQPEGAANWSPSPWRWECVDGLYRLRDRRGFPVATVERSAEYGREDALLMAAAPQLFGALLAATASLRASEAELLRLGVDRALGRRPAWYRAAVEALKDARGEP